MIDYDEMDMIVTHMCIYQDHHYTSKTPPPHDSLRALQKLQVRANLASAKEKRKLIREGLRRLALNYLKISIRNSRVRL